MDHNRLPWFDVGRMKDVRTKRGERKKAKYNKGITGSEWVKNKTINLNALRIQRSAKTLGYRTLQMDSSHVVFRRGGPSKPSK